MISSSIYIFRKYILCSKTSLVLHVIVTNPPFNEANGVQPLQWRKSYLPKFQTFPCYYILRKNKEPLNIIENSLRLSQCARVSEITNIGCESLTEFPTVVPDDTRTSNRWWWWSQLSVITWLLDAKLDTAAKNEDEGNNVVSKSSSLSKELHISFASSSAQWRDESK